MNMKTPANNTPPQGYRMTELGVLPEEWEVVRLGEVAYFETGKRMKGGALEKGEVLSLGGEHIGNFGELNLSQPKYITKEFYDNLKKGKVNVGDVIICKDGAKTGKLAYIKKEFDYQIAINEHVFIIRSKNYQFLHNHFIFFFLFSNFGQNQIREAFHGLIGGITNSDIFNFLIPLPPLPEQQKIAAVLSAVQEAKEKTEAVIAATKALKKSMMKHLFTYGPVSPEETETVSLKETEIGPVPEDWEVVRLGEVAIENKGIQRGPWGGSIKKEIFVPSGYAVYEQGNVISGNVTNFRYFINEKKYKELKDFEVKGGDVLITAAGTLGKLVILPDKIYKGIINQALIRIRLNETTINNVYFKYIFNQIVEKGIIASYSHGATLKNLSSIRVLQNIKIPLPPLPIQQKIASILSAIDVKIEAEENKKKALEELFKSLLHNLMTAKIRVNKLGVTS